MVKKRKKKGEITDGRNIYEQLSLFFESVSSYAEDEESPKLFTIRDEWKIEGSTGKSAERYQYSTDENAGGNISGDGFMQFAGLYGSSESQSKNTEYSSEEDRGMDIQYRTIYNDNFRITDKDEKLNSKEKFIRNIKALEVINDDSVPFSVKQEIVSKYTAWGGLPQIFDEGNIRWATERERLKRSVTSEQYLQMKSSVLTSFYTPYEVIEGIYRIIEHLGFSKGKILDPCCGTGNFIGVMPEEIMNESSIFGVELDEISGKMAQILYPKTAIQINGFEKTSFPDDYFDLAVSNVPFGRYKVHDIRYNRLNLDIHNYFFIKTLDKVRAGGIVAFITSSSTLDGNTRIRELINERAELICAIRLPESTFRTNGANTDVVSDIIILQKKESGDIARNNITWVNRTLFSENVMVNEYFIENPQMVFGDMTVKKNQFGDDVISVRDNGLSFSTMINRIIDDIPYHIFEETEEISIEGTDMIPMESRHFSYRINEYFIENDELFRRMDNHIARVTENTEQIKMLVNISDTVKRIISIQKNEDDDYTFSSELSVLNRIYDDYVKIYGFINTRTTISIIKDDPNFYLLTALENIDTGDRSIRKSDFFFRRTIKQSREAISAETLEDALSHSFNYCGNMNIGYMETIYHKSQQDIENELVSKKYAYRDPLSSELIYKDEYLSGNIRKKLEIAMEENQNKDVFNSNIEDLNRVLPEWLTADQIQVQMGAIWIPQEYYEQFADHLFSFSWYRKDQFHVSYSRYTGQWIIESWNENYDASICRTWGVAKVKDDFGYSQPMYNGFSLFDDIMNSRIPTIRDYWDETDENGNIRRKSKINTQRTAIARTLADRMEIEFEEWIYDDPERRERLERIYNERFNSYVERIYDGSHLTFPDMNIALKLEKYQKDAVARIISSKATLLSQRVGAGKTFEMVTACMEMKRMGIAEKSLIVVPNHLVEQWRSEFLTAYPQAKILAATSGDMEKKKRNEFIHKIAVNDYDAIIMSHSSFKLIPVSNDILIEEMRREISDIEFGIEGLQLSDGYGNSKHIKVLEKTKKSIEANVQKLLEVRRDNGITFDQLGIDYIFVDEAHEFKNLYIYSRMSNVAGVPQTRSQKASDMYMKTRYILQNGGGVCFATGTPISNTMAELYNLQRYLQEDTLHESGIYCFDAWAKNFGEVVSQLEISIDGSGFRTRQRFSRFFNIQELMSMFRQVATIQTEGMLKRELMNSQTGRNHVIPPRHIGGSPTVIAIDPSTELEDYIADVVERTEQIHNGNVDPREDNMLKVTTDSKKASIDMRLIDEDYGCIAGSKIDVVIRNILDLWTDYKDMKATQIVFCDTSTPSDSFNIYDEVKKGLMNFGIPEDEIAFIHDAKTEKQKSVLFGKVKTGSVRILMGSTAKLGAGTNVQDRLIAVHHVDVPWRASDIEQRNGRAFRQGNMFDEIYEFRYVTKKSFDAYSWQMIETKASYMNQLLEGTTSAREIEEDNSSMMSYAEVKAIASGNPLIREKMEVDNELRQLRLEKSVYRKNRFNAEKRLIAIPSEIKETEEKIKRIEPDLEYAVTCCQNFREENIEDWFSAEINNKVFSSMKEAGDEMERMVSCYHEPMIHNKLHILGNFCGFSFGIMNGNLAIEGKERNYQLSYTLHAVGRVNFLRLLKSIHRIPESYQDEKIMLDTLRKNQKNYEKIASSVFEKEEYLRKLIARERELNELLDVNSHQSETVIDEEELG